MVAPFRRRAEPAAVTRTPEQEERHEVALVVQGQYRRRIGETLEVVNAAGTVETVRIQNINAGDDQAEVIIVHANKRIETIPALKLAEQETLAAELAATATGGASRVIRLGNAAEVTDIAGSTKKKFKMRYGAVDVSDAVEERARDAAEEELHREKGELSGIGGFIAKIWKHNVAYEIYRQVGIARARNKILTDKNLYTNEGLQKADHQRAVAAVVDRFVEEHQNSLHQQGADGERKEKLKTSSAEVAVKAKLNDLVREFAANPAMDEDELEKRKLSIFKEASAFAGEAKGRGVMVADNMIEIAKAVREHALHAGGINNLDIDLEFVIGKAKMGARTEQEKSAIDKALEGMDRLTSKHGITAGIWGVARSGVAVAGAIGLTMAQMMAKSNLAKAVTFGGSALATGLFSWWREKGRTNREHALHERQRALGGQLRAEQDVTELNAEEIQLNAQMDALRWWQPVERANLRARIAKVSDTKQPRREKMDEFALHRVNARDLSDRGQAFLTPDGQLKPGLDPADAMRALADMEARVSIGNIEKKDLLQYSGVAEVEIERRDLDETRMVLKAALRAANANFEFDYDGIYNGVVGVITDHKNTQQKNFDEYAKKRAKNAALIAVGSGLVVGFGAHEIWAWATGNETVTESFGKAGTWLMNYLNSTPAVPPLQTGAPVLHVFADGAINTPPGTELLQQADGSWSLQAIADHHVIADGLHIGSNGSLDAASVHALENLGGTVAQQDVMTDNVTTVTEQVGIWDWLRGHAPDVSHVKRDIWMGNDTPAPVFDFNEQGLHWGQVNGISASGDSYTMSLNTMTAGGSWQNGLHIDPLQKTANGNMRLVLTLSEGSQNHAITLVPDADGNFTIPMNSDIGRTLFTTDQSVIDAALAANPRLHHVAGEPFFLGHHAEIAMSRGFDDAGVEHLAILATHTGSGLDHGVITRDIGECVEKHMTEIRLPSGATDPNAFPPIVLPPIIPIRARTPLERLATRQSVTPPSASPSSSEAATEEETNPLPDMQTVLGGLRANERSTAALIERMRASSKLVAPQAESVPVPDMRTTLDALERVRRIREAESHNPGGVPHETDLSALGLSALAGLASVRLGNTVKATEALVTLPPGAVQAKSRAEDVAVLGLSPDATLEQARKAFRDISRAMHPDVGAGDVAHFSAVQEAWARIRDGQYAAAGDKAREIRLIEAVPDFREYIVHGEKVSDIMIIDLIIAEVRREKRLKPDVVADLERVMNDTLNKANLSKKIKDEKLQEFSEAVKRRQIS